MSDTKRITRRDMLKLMALSSVALTARPLISALGKAVAADAPNVLIFVFDAWSAQNVNLLGYPRETMPTLTRFADRSYVFHNHYSTASFTVPGTASLLTGLYPWTHRAVQLSAGGVTSTHENHNLFAMLEDSLSTFGYSQNPFADLLLYQFEKSIDTRLADSEFNLERYRLSNLPIFQNDAQVAFTSIENNFVRNGKGYSGSLFYGILSRLASLSKYADVRRKYIRDYPAGLPIAAGNFLLDTVIDGAIESLGQLSDPSLAYFHFFPPHEPYAPRAEHAELFDDGWAPPEKPLHPLSSRTPRAVMLEERLRYDQYLVSWDAEFARLLSYLETSGMLEKSIVIITSDHGQMFESGEIGHNTPLLSRPVVHVPLMISLPGQTGRKDIRDFTSSVDLLPTIANLVGAPPPPWTEGRLLPGLGGEADPNRSVYSIDAKTASSFAPFRRYSLALMKQGHRLIHYQYPDYSNFEFYNVEDDPNEVNDLYPSKPALALQMQEELLQKVDEINLPYE